MPKPEGNEKAESNKEGKSSGGLSSPEAILMLCVAGILDGIGFILFLLSWLGVDDYGVLDILGGIIIGGWIFIRHGPEAATSAIRRLLIAFGIEVVPFLGGLSPSWIILVWKTLKT
jgi:hypothetical protein